MAAVPDSWGHFFDNEGKVIIRHHGEEISESVLHTADTVVKIEGQKVTVEKSRNLKSGYTFSLEDEVKEWRECDGDCPAQAGPATTKAGERGREIK